MWLVAVSKLSKLSYAFSVHITGSPDTRTAFISLALIGAEEKNVVSRIAGGFTAYVA